MSSARGGARFHLAWLPTGHTLGPEEGMRRHVAASRTLAGAVAAVWLLAATVRGLDGHVTSEALGLAALAVLGWRAPWSLRTRSVITAAGLIGVAALAVHVTGTIEAHFLFFIAIPLVAFYEDWAPFATATTLVFLHHGVVGVLAPASVYNHPEAIASPWRWAGVHTALLAVMCLASLAHWRLHEDARSEQRTLHAELERRALQDPLTGLANRTLLLDRLTHALAAHERSGEPVALLVIDLDGFKPINDTCGHHAGDAVLVELADRLRACSRAGDTVGRLGGDEFALLAPDADRCAAERLADRLLDVIARPLAGARTDQQVTASIGVAVTEGGAAEDPDELLRRADAAMYDAKRNGRDRYATATATVESSAGPPTILVDAQDARAWRDYVTELRDQIAARKAAGSLPATLRGPESVRRTLLGLLNAIDQLPTGRVGDLPIHDQHALEELVYHQLAVHHWADSLVGDGELHARRSPAADRFIRDLGASLEKLATRVEAI